MDCPKWCEGSRRLVIVEVNDTGLSPPDAIELGRVYKLISISRLDSSVAIHEATSCFIFTSDTSTSHHGITRGAAAILNLGRLTQEGTYGERNPRRRGYGAAVLVGAEPHFRLKADRSYRSSLGSLC